MNTTEAPEFWLTVQEAADLMGIKRRRMLDYRNQITSRRVDNPRSGKTVLMFDRASVEQWLTRREELKAAGLLRPPAPAPDNGAAVAVRAFGKTTALLRAMSELEPAAHAVPPLPLFLDLDQASTYTGLSPRLLRSMIGTGELPARRDGRAWKIRKTALRDISNQDRKDNGL